MILLIVQALSFIPADDRDIWIKCGMAIKSELGEAGFSIWDAWSATSDAYRARDAAMTWKSFKSSGSVGIGTLFRIAQQNGYKCDHEHKPKLMTAEETAQRKAQHQAEIHSMARRREAASSKADSIWNNLGTEIGSETTGSR